MIAADFRVCLDACVLANAGLCDIFLRLAEHPALYSPVFSLEILSEVRHVKTQKLKRKWSEETADYWEDEVKKAFPEALVEGYEPLLPILTNDVKDRHVLAVAIRGQAPVVVTFNLRHFKSEDLKPWDVVAIHPQDYLVTLYEMSPDVVLSKIYAIANDRGKPPEICLSSLSNCVPLFVDHVASAVGWNL